MKVEGVKERNLDFSREIFEARVMIRENNYLSLSNNRLSTFTVKKSNVQAAFESFLEHCESNQSKYYSSFLQEKPCNLHSISNRDYGADAPADQKDFLKQIRQKIRTLPDSIQQFYRKESRKCMTVPELCDFLATIEEEIRDVEARDEQRV
jgi:hypothetical protein